MPENGVSRHNTPCYWCVRYCAIRHLSAFYECFHAFTSDTHATCTLMRPTLIAVRTCWLLLPRLRLAVQRYDTKTILTNFCVKISQWNVFLGRRRHFCRIVLCRRLRHTWQKRHAFNTEQGRRLRTTWPEYTCLKPYKAAMRNAYDWMMAATVFLPRTTDLLSTWNANLLHVI